MSRSYKHQPIATDGSPRSTHQSKKLASRKVRQYLKSSDELLQGAIYKRHFESYEIHDYKFRYSWEEAKQDYFSGEFRHHNRFPDLQDFYKWWRKYYRDK